MKELDELVKVEEPQKNDLKNEDENKNNENKIIIEENLNSTENKENDEKSENNNEENKDKIIIEEEENSQKEKKEKVKYIKEQLKYRARLLDVNNFDVFCYIIDNISTEPIDEFKKFVVDCQIKFDQYEKTFGFVVIEASSEKTNLENLEKLQNDQQNYMQDIATHFYDEAKKQVEKFLAPKKEDDKDNPKILAVEFVLVFMDKHKTSGMYKFLQHLTHVIMNFDKSDDFVKNLQEIFKNVSSKNNSPNEKLFDSDLSKMFYNLLAKINDNYSKSILDAINNCRDDQTPENFLTDSLNQKDNTLVSEFFKFAFNDKLGSVHIKEI